MFNDSTDDSTEYGFPGKFYVFTHKSQNFKSQDLVIDDMHAKSIDNLHITRAVDGLRDHSLPLREHVITGFEGTLRSCGPRRQMVGSYVCEAFGQWMRNPKSYPADFMNELTLSLLDM